VAELKQDPTHPLKHEQCYLCFTTFVEPPPANAPSRADLRRPHKEYMARLESEGRLFGAGLLKNDKDKESFSVFENERGVWLWKCFAGCGTGDGVDYLAKRFGLSTREAIARYCAEAGLNGSPAEPTASTAFDWPACVAAMTANSW